MAANSERFAMVVLVLIPPLLLSSCVVHCRPQRNDRAGLSVLYVRWLLADRRQLDPFAVSELFADSAFRQYTYAPRGRSPRTSTGEQQRRGKRSLVDRRRADARGPSTTDGPLRFPLLWRSAGARQETGYRKGRNGRGGRAFKNWSLEKRTHGGDDRSVLEVFTAPTLYSRDLYRHQDVDSDDNDGEIVRFVVEETLLHSDSEGNDEVSSRSMDGDEELRVPSPLKGFLGKLLGKRDVNVPGSFASSPATAPTVQRHDRAGGVESPPVAMEPQYDERCRA